MTLLLGENEHLPVPEALRRARVALADTSASLQLRINCSTMANAAERCGSQMFSSTSIAHPAIIEA